MIDLIGFWSTVTLLIAPVVLIIYLMLEAFINLEVKKITDNERRFEPVHSWYMKNVWRPIYRADFVFPYVFFVVVLYTFLLFFYCAGATHAEYTIIDLISRVSTDLAPVMGWVGVVVGVFVAYILTVRVGLKKLYQFYKKVEKL